MPTSSDVFSTATLLAILQAGRAPVWEAQDPGEALTPPNAANDGIYLEGSTRALVHVSLREQAHRRTVRLTIPVVDLSAVYTTTINGTAVAYDASSGGADANVAAVVDGITTAINANGTVNVIVTATAVGADDDEDASHTTVLIRGDVEADFSIDFTEGGSATVLATADYASAEMRLWWYCGARSDSTAPAVWASTGELFDVDRHHALVRLDTAGLDRLAVQLSSREGHAGDGAAVAYTDPVISIGPCLSEVI